MPSAYLPITPIAEGSPDIECLHSFFARMARLHGISLCQLARHLGNWYRRRGHAGFRLPEAHLYGKGTPLCGFSPNIDLYLEVLAEAVQYPTLYRTTLLVLRNVLSGSSQGVIKRTRAWCPACLREKVRNEEAAYDKLVWMLAAVQRCADHQLALESNCPTCGTPQTYYHRSGSMERCWRCSDYLLSEPCKWRRVAQVGFGEVDSADLVAAISSGQLDGLAGDPIRAFEMELGAVMSPYRWTVEAVAPPSGSKRARHEHAKPTLPALLRKAHVAGVPAIEILTSPIEAARVAGELELARRDVPISRRPRHAGAAVEEVRQHLENQLARDREEAIPSLRSLCRALNLSDGFVRYHGAELIGPYVRRRIAYRQRQTARLKSRTRKLLRNELLPAYLAGEIRSHDALAERLVALLGVTECFARREVRRAVGEGVAKC